MLLCAKTHIAAQVHLNLPEASKDLHWVSPKHTAPHTGQPCIKTSYSQITVEAPQNEAHGFWQQSCIDNAYIDGSMQSAAHKLAYCHAATDCLKLQLIQLWTDFMRLVHSGKAVSLTAAHSPHRQCGLASSCYLPKPWHRPPRFQKPPRCCFNGCTTFNYVKCGSIGVAISITASCLQHNECCLQLL